MVSLREYHEPCDKTYTDGTTEMYPNANTLAQGTIDLRFDDLINKIKWAKLLFFCSWFKLPRGRNIFAPICLYLLIVITTY